MAGLPPYNPSYPGGYPPPPAAGLYPPAYPGYGPTPYYTGEPAPQSERPPKEHCFYIKSKVGGLVMEVENAGVDPGTRVVMMPMSGQGKDCELWFEDYQTGTIKSRLNLLCLDIKDVNQPHQVINSPQIVPSNAVCPTSVGGRIFYCAVAHTEWGNIPGRAVAKQCWYSYDGAEYCTADFSWITAPNTKLIRNTGSPPAGAIGAGHQQDDGCTYYSAIARSQWGRIPGKAKGNTCWYAYNGSEHYTSDFDWIVIGSDFIVLNPYAPGSHTQLWLRSADKIQNRQDGSKVVQMDCAAKGSQVLSTFASNDVKQKWIFCNYGTQTVTKSIDPIVKSMQQFTFSQPPSYQEVSMGERVIKSAPVRRYFFIKSELHGKVLDVAGESKQPGTMVIMWPQKSSPAANQLWYLDDNGFIRSKLTDFCLQPSGHGIWLQPYTNQPNQMWTPQGNRIVLLNNPNICLDIHGEEKKDGAKLCQFKYKGSANQHWRLVYIN